MLPHSRKMGMMLLEKENNVHMLPSEIMGSIVKLCPGFIIPTALFSEKTGKKIKRSTIHSHLTKIDINF